MVLHVTVITVVHGCYNHVGLFVKAYPSNMSRILNKDLTRFMPIKVFLKYAKIELVKERFC